MALSNAQIKQIQKIVGASVDGIWGPQTKAAVQRWQSAHGLSPDGVVGPLTLGKMGLNSGAGGTGGSAGAKSTTSGPSTPAMEKFAEDYGYQLAFLKSDPELYGKFQEAMTHKWDSTRFVAAVKQTKWYKTHGEAYRQNLALKTTDPGTWKQRVQAQIATVGDLAGSIGAGLSTKELAQLAEQSVLFGWSDAQLRNTLAYKIKPGAKTGEAGNIRAKIREAVWRNGTTASEGFITNWQRRIEAGQATLDNVTQQIRETYGTRIAPGFATELKAGQDLYDIAAPYMQTMAQTLELNPSDIDLFDPTIRKTLAGGPADKGGHANTPSMWEFEQNLRQDKRFLKTKQAQDQTMSVGNKVLQDFGLVK